MQLIFIIQSGDKQYIARVVSFVAGMPLAERLPSARLCRNMGDFLAHLGLALENFTHPGSKHSLLWDMQKALSVRKLLQYVPGQSASQLVDVTLREFEDLALPLFPSLRAQVIHNDLNPDNVLIDPQNPDKMVGVIDFGDMLHAPLVVDVAIAASYLRQMEGNPLATDCRVCFGVSRRRTIDQRRDRYPVYVNQDAPGCIDRNIELARCVEGRKRSLSCEYVER